MSWYQCWKDCRRKEKAQKLACLVEEGLQARKEHESKQGWGYSVLLGTLSSPKLATREDIYDIEKKIHEIEKKLKKRKK